MYMYIGPYLAGGAPKLYSSHSTQKHFIMLQQPAQMIQALLVYM